MGDNIQIHNVQRLRYIEEATFGTDHTTTMASFTDIPFIEDSATAELMQPLESPGHARQTPHAHPKEILMPKSGKISFSTNLVCPTSRAGDGDTIATTPTGTLLKLAWGDEDKLAGDTVKDSGTTISYNATTPARHVAGGAKAFSLSSVLYCRELQEVSGSSCTLKLALPSALTTADVVYGCATYYLGGVDANLTKSGQFILEGMGSSGGGYEDTWCLMGCQLESMAFQLPVGGIPRIDWVFQAADWENGDDLTAGYTPAALGTATYSNNVEKVMVDSYFHAPTVGVSAISVYHPSEMSLESPVGYIPVKTPGGTNNIESYIMNGEHPKATGSFTLPYEDQTWTDARAARTEKAIFLQIGSSVSTGAMLITIPNAQIKEWSRQGVDGIAGQTITWLARLDGDTTESTATALGQSPIRVHVF